LERETGHFHYQIPIGRRILKPDVGVSSKPIRAHFPNSLYKTLHKQLGNVQLCQSCGAIPFDLILSDGLRFYYFTCWKITKDDRPEQTIIETDYRKFAEYCQAINDEKKE
jgi:hypothetical protein